MLRQQQEDMDAHVQTETIATMTTTVSLLHHSYKG